MRSGASAIAVRAWGLSTTVIVQILNPLCDASWEARLVSHPSAAIFHTTGWARVVHATYGLTPHYLALKRPDGADALLPLFQTSPWPGRRHGVCVPFADFCSPLAPDTDTARALFDRACALGRELRWRSLEIRGGRDHWRDAPAAPRYLAHTLAFDSPGATHFDRLPPENRRAIRRGRRAGLQVEFSTAPEAMAAYYRLHELTRRRHGAPPQPPRFFRCLHAHIIAPGQGFVALVRKQGRPIAGAVFLGFKNRAVYKFGASDARHLDDRPNNLLFWESLEYLRDRGFGELHFGRTSPTNTGLRRFKLSWASRESDVDYVRYDLTHHRFVASHEGGHRLAAALFRRTPLLVNRLIGAALYKHLA